MTAPHDHVTPVEERASVGELLSEISSDITTLMRQEVELAKAELTQSAKRAGRGAGMFAGAGVAGNMTLIFLSVAAWWAIGDETGRGWSALIVAAVWALVAAVLAVMGRQEIKAVPGAPQTKNTVKKIPSAVAGHEETL